MTNAHVVAGVGSPVVRIATTRLRRHGRLLRPRRRRGRARGARSRRPALDFAARPPRVTPAAVLGYPENGPYDVQPARIRDEQTLRSPNIYGDDAVYREVYSIYSRSGPATRVARWSTSSGDVLGVIFAASVTDGARATRSPPSRWPRLPTAGSSANRPVDTGDCVA